MDVEPCSMDDSIGVAGGDGNGFLDISTLIPEELFLDLRVIGVVSV